MSEKMHKTAAFALLSLMVLAQLALACHASVHAHGHFYPAPAHETAGQTQQEAHNHHIRHDHHHDGEKAPSDEPAHSKKCSLCLLGKSFASVLWHFTPGPAASLSLRPAPALTPTAVSHATAIRKENPPRAPPAFLS